MTPQFSDMNSSSFFWRFHISLAKFSYWFKFHVNIITDFSLMKVFVYKRLAWNPVIGNTTFWVLFDMWILEQDRDVKLGPNDSNKMLLNAAKCQGYSFYRFWVIKGKPTGGGVPPLRVNNYNNIYKQLYLWLNRRLKLNFYAGFFQGSGVVI